MDTHQHMYSVIRRNAHTNRCKHTHLMHTCTHDHTLHMHTQKPMHACKHPHYVHTPMYTHTHIHTHTHSCTHPCTHRSSATSFLCKRCLNVHTPAANLLQDGIQQRHVVLLSLNSVREEHVGLVRNEMFNGHLLHAFELRIGRFMHPSMSTPSPPPPLPVRAGSGDLKLLDYLYVIFFRTREV